MIDLERVKEAMQAAAAEIRELRRQNEVLGAKVAMIELFETVLFSMPNRPLQGYAEDVAAKLERLGRDIEAEIAVPEKAQV